MNTLKDGAILISVAAWASLALAAAPAPSASGAAPDGYATMAKSIGKTKANAKAEEDERMTKCKGMKGDEKKGCEAYAKALASEAMSKSGPSSGGDGAPKK